MIVGGCDIGSVSGKVVLLKDDQVIGYSIVPCSIESEETAGRALAEALKAAGISRQDVNYIVGTGYGKVNISFASDHVTEISCHGRGAFFINPKIRTVLDIGGQDCKVIKIDASGAVKDFVMNDKCAAGGGIFLDDIAKVLEMKVESLGPLSEKAAEKIKISNQCSVFALSEVISLVAEKKAVTDIVAGINDSIASRLVSMVHRVGLEEEAFLSGGVAKNIGVVKGLEEKLGIKLATSPFDPQITGALGAALFAKKAVLEKKPA